MSAATGSSSSTLNATTTSTSSTPVAKAMVVPATTLGMNMGQPNYYASEWAFTNILKNTGDFQTSNQDLRHIDMTALKIITPGGWPTNVPVNTVLELFINDTPYWQTGTYSCEVTTGWHIENEHDGATISSDGSSGKFDLVIGASKPGDSVTFRFTATKDGASLDKFSCTPKGKTATLVNQPWLDDNKPFKVVRFMEWMHANNSTVTSWADRPLPSDFSIVPRGASVEDMVALANANGVDPWFCLPFDASDEYVRNFATYVRDHLATGHKVYAELSNEVWNWSFKQAQDAITRGQAKYPNVNQVTAMDYYYSDRVKSFMAIWNQVFAGQMSRVVRVASTQNDWIDRAENILSHGNLWQTVDSIASAPYFGTNISDITSTGATRVNAVFARLPGQADSAISSAVAVKAIAYKYGVNFMTYEGGPDVNGWTQDQRDDCDAIMADPRMYTVYMNFLKKWQTQVGGMLVLYDGTMAAGTFSHRKYTGQPVGATTQKLRALTDFAKTLSN